MSGESVLVQATPDGTRLFTARSPGRTGHTPLVFLDGLGCAGFAFSKLKRAYAHPRGWWTFHYRGHGESDIPKVIETMNLEQCVADLFFLLDAAGHDDVILVGHSMGVQVALEAARTAPHRVKGMVLLCGSYAYPIESWHGAPQRDEGPRLANEVFKRAFGPVSARLIQYRAFVQPVWSHILKWPAAYEIGTRTEVDGKKLTPREFGQYLTDLADMDASVFFRFARDLAAHSSGPYLHTLNAPGLVVVGTHDTYTPMWRGQELAARLPTAELVIIDRGTHTAPLEDPVTVHARLDAFLDRHAL